VQLSTQSLQLVHGRGNQTTAHDFLLIAKLGFIGFAPNSTCQLWLVLESHQFTLSPDVNCRQLVCSRQ